MGRELSSEAEALLRAVEQAVDTPTVRLTPLLLRLSRLAPVGSQAWAYAQRLLAEGLATEDPWQGSLLARRAVAVDESDPRAWAVLGLCQSLLGHHRFAIRAYRRALELSPANPHYAHNLGHLYDVAMDQPERALPLLERAFAQLPHQREVAASYAHALWRMGAVDRARQVMRPVARHSNLPHHHDLYGAIVERHDRDVAARLAEQPRGPTVPRRRLKRRRTYGQRPESVRRSTT
jgi:Flp pilus assembly protein TadD